MWDWRSSAKTLPRPTDPVLGLTDMDELVVVYYDYDSSWHLAYNDEIVPNIIYWTNLPILIP